MYNPTELFTAMALMIFIMGVFVSLCVACGVANARAEVKRSAAAAPAIMREERRKPGKPLRPSAIDLPES